MKKYETKQKRNEERYIKIRIRNIINERKHENKRMEKECKRETICLRKKKTFKRAR
jgi:hypothetical protein